MNSSDNASRNRLPYDVINSSSENMRRHVCTTLRHRGCMAMLLCSMPGAVDTSCAENSGACKIERYNLAGGRSSTQG